MPIPEYEAIKLPALTILADGKARSLTELRPVLASAFNLTLEEGSEMLPSGTQPRWNNRVNWACYDLFRAGILERPKKGIYKITDFGRKILEKKPASLDRTYLRQFPEFLKWET